MRTGLSISVIVIIIHYYSVLLMLLLIPAVTIDTVYTNTLHVILNCVNTALNVFMHYNYCKTLYNSCKCFWNVVSI